MRRIPSSQQGAALIGVIFLILVVAILGAFAVRTATDQRQISTLTLMEARANAAAFSGLEYAANRLKSGAAFACPAAPAIPSSVVVALPAVPQTNVIVRCTALASGAGNVYTLTATASSGAFGNPDYVQRVRTRRVSSIGAGSW